MSLGGRTRPSKMAKAGGLFAGKDMLSLKHFIMRSTVLAQYRSMIRASAGFAESDRLRIQGQIRSGFEANRDVTDPVAISYHLSKGEEQLKFLKGGNKSMGVVRGNSEDSWIGKGPDDDRHGRVGSGWPWKKS